MRIDARQLALLSTDQKIILIPRVRKMLEGVEESLNRNIDRYDCIKSLARQDRLEARRRSIAALLGVLELAAFQSVFGFQTVLKAPPWNGDEVVEVPAE